MSPEPAEEFEAALKGLDETSIKGAERELAVSDGGELLGEAGFLAGELRVVADVVIEIEAVLEEFEQVVSQAKQFGESRGSGLTL